MRHLPIWLWVPTLYFAESVPNAVVLDTAKFLYTDLGVTPQALGVLTGSMNLPWMIKPLWSPVLELMRTKRWWIFAMQLLLGLSFFVVAASLQTPNWLRLSAAAFWIIAFLSATHDIAADGFYMLSLNERAQAAYTGVRTTAYRLGMLCAKGALVFLAGSFTVAYGKMAGWSTVMCIPAVFFLFAGIYHMLLLPRPEADVPVRENNFVAGYWESFSSFFAKEGIGQALAFMLLFRLGEAQLLAMVPPFLTSSHEKGGLAMSVSSVGIAYGTYGMVGMICGGLSAGFLVNRYGLRRMYWPMILLMHLPNLAFLFLAYALPESVTLIAACLFLEQFGYGFGFTAYTLFLMYFAKGERQTAHFAICTGFMTMGKMFPEMASGFIQHALGFRGFFVYITLCTIPSFFVAWRAWCNRDFIANFPAKNEPRMVDL